jgi:hypothetical protein
MCLFCFWITGKKIIFFLWDKKSCFLKYVPMSRLVQLELVVVNCLVAGGSGWFGFFNWMFLFLFLFFIGRRLEILVEELMWRFVILFHFLFDLMYAVLVSYYGYSQPLSNVLWLLAYKISLGVFENVGNCWIDVVYWHRGHSLPMPTSCNESYELTGS